MFPWEEEQTVRGNHEEVILNDPSIGGVNIGRLSRGGDLEWKEWGWVEAPKRKCDQNILYEKNIEI